MQEFLWIVNDLPAFCAVCYDAEVFTEEECYMANPSLDAWVQERPDFCAEVRFYEEAEGGMSEAPVQGARWGFQYLNDPDKSWILHMCFLDAAGEPLPSGVEVPRTCEAYLRIEDDQMRCQVHRSLVEPGTEFFLTSGNCRVAEGTVCELVGLHQDEPA